MIHELKMLPECFEAVVDGRNRFEIRRDDQNYEVGDYLILRECKYYVRQHLDGLKESMLSFTGRAYETVITYINDCAQRDGYVVMGIRGI